MEMDVSNEIEFNKPALSEVGEVMVEIEGQGTVCLAGNSVFELTRFDGSKVQVTGLMSDDDEGLVSFFTIPTHWVQNNNNDSNNLFVEQTLLVENEPTEFILDDEAAVAVPPDTVVPRKEFQGGFEVTDQLMDVTDEADVTDVTGLNQLTDFTSNISVLELVDPLNKKKKASIQSVIKKAGCSSNIVPVLGSEVDEQLFVPEESQLVVQAVQTKPKEPSQARRGRPKKEKDVDPPLRKGPYVCEVCNAKVLTWPQFKAHKHIHEEETKPFVCKVCCMSFNVEKNLNLHMLLHNVGNLTCPECRKTFTRMASFKAHLPVHEEEENMFCSECGDEFCNVAQLEHHHRAHREAWELEISASRGAGRKRLSCKSCNRIFTNPVSFEVHKRDHQRLRSQLTALAPKRKRRRLKGSITLKYGNVCEVCNKSFPKPSHLVRHRRVHTGERPFKCDSCNAAFSQKGSLQIHMSMHSGHKPYVCSCCSLSFSQRGNLITHVNKVHRIPKEGEEIYQCLKCPCSFKKLASLNCHVTRFHVGLKSADSVIYSDAISSEYNVDSLLTQLAELKSNLPANCDMDILQTAIRISGLQVNGKADLSESMKENLLVDLNQLEGVDPERLEEEVRFVTIADRTDEGTVKHLSVRQRTEGNVRWHQCNTCSKEFKKPSDLIRHIRIHTREKPFRCNQCFRTFSTKSTLKCHIRTHEAAKLHECKICLKRVASSRSLKIHYRSHSGTKPFACNVCSKAFATTGQLKTHYSTNSHKLRDETAEANKNFFMEEPFIVVGDGEFKQQLSRKEKLISQSEHATSSERPYRCEYCNLKFRKSSHVKQHKLQHTGERPYLCVVCDKRFTTKGVLKMHLKTHLGQKDFSCDKCSSKFSTKGSLKRHIQTFHSEERPYLCPYCQKRFKTSVNCKKHIKIHRYDSNQQFFGVKLDDVYVEEHEDDPAARAIVVHAKDPDPEDVPVTAEAIDYQPNVEVISQTLLADASGTITLPALSQETLTQESIRELEQTLNQQLFGAAAAEPLPMVELMDHAQAEPSIVHAVFAQPDELQTVSNLSDILPESNPTRDQDPREEPPLEEGHVCETCGKACSSAAALRAHGKTHSGRELQCELCEWTTTSKASLKRHTNIHCGEKRFPCPDCPAKFRLETHLKKHQKLHAATKEERPSRHSRRSKRPFIELSDAETEILAAQDVRHGASVSEKILIASAAEKVRMDEKKKLNGAGAEEEEPRANLGNNCNYCQKSFRKPSDLVRHVRVHTGERPFQCTHCSRSFTVKSTLSSHLRTHFRAKPVTCHICHSMFAARSSLKIHMRLHTGARPFECQLCGQKFRTSGHRKNHMTSHTKNKPKTWRKQQLEMLNNIAIALVESYKDGQPAPGTEDVDVDLIKKEPSVELQVFNDMPTEQLQLSDPLFVGDLQNRQELPVEDNPSNEPVRFEIYTSDGHVYNITHQDPNLIFYPPEEKDQMDEEHPSASAREVEGVRSHQCQVCAKVFAKKSQLERHQRVHTGERPFSCDICGRRFTQSNALEAHLKAHRGERSHSCPYCDFACVQKGNLRVHISRTHLAYYLDRDKNSNKSKEGRGSKTTVNASVLLDNTESLLDSGEKARTSDLDQVVGELFPQVT